MKAIALAFLLQAAGPGPEDKQAEEAIETFKAAFKSTSESERAGAVTALAATVHLKTLARIVPLLTADAPPVRCAAAKGLGAFGDFRKKAVPALVAALGPNSKDPTVLAAILETLGKIGDASALPPIHKLFDEKDSRTAKAALEAAAGIGSSGSVDALLDQLKKLERQAKEDTTGGVNSGVGGQGGQNYNVPADDTARRRAQELLPVVNKTLQAITREKHGSYAEWQGWWARNRAQFKAEK